MEEKFIFKAHDAVPEKQLGDTVKETAAQNVSEFADAVPRTEVPEIRKVDSQKTARAPKTGKSTGKEKSGFWSRFSPSGKIAFVLGLLLIVGSIAGVLLSGALSVPTGTNSGSNSGGKPGGNPSQGGETPTTPAENLVTEQTATVLQKTEDAGEEYIKETLFIGDSNYNRFYFLNLLSLDNVIGVDGMGIQSVPAAPVVYFVEKSNPVSIPTAVANMRPRRIIMNYGTNNLVSGNVDSFIENYNDAIDAIKNAYPYADIIVSSIPPVGKNLDPGYSMVDYQKVYTYNSALIKMCEERGIHYLNVTEELLRSADGYCKSEYITGDGIHLEQTALEKVLEYVRTHALLTEDTRPESTEAKWTRKAAPIVVYQYQCDQVVATAMEEFFDAGYISYKKVKEGEKEENYRDPETYTFTIAKSEATKGSEEEMGLALFHYVHAKVSNPEKAQVTIAYKVSDDGDYVFKITVKEVCLHDFTVTETTEATCTHGGSKTMVCSICGKKKVVTTDPLDHEYDWSTATDYDEAAGTVKVKCKLCEKYYDVAHGDDDHEWGEESVSAEPTCTAAGKKKATCKICGTTKELEIPKLGHDFSVYLKIEKEPTCEKEGTASYQCSRCEEKTTKPVDALGHDYSVYVGIDKEPTCEKEGSATYQCSRCDKKTTKPVDALGHDYSVYVKDDPAATCEGEGSAVYQCSRCSSQTRKTLAPLGHLWGDWVVDVEPQIGVAGHRFRTCTREGCGATQEEAVDPLPEPEPEPEPGDGGNAVVLPRWVSFSLS